MSVYPLTGDNYLLILTCITSVYTLNAFNEILSSQKRLQYSACAGKEPVLTCHVKIKPVSNESSLSLGHQMSELVSSHYESVSNKRERERMNVLCYILMNTINDFLWEIMFKLSMD